MDKIKTESSGQLVENQSRTLGDRATSDVIVRLKTGDGRDDWFYSHTDILCKHSKFFASRLSREWPTCHFLDSRNCIELPCLENDIDFHITLLRLLYARDERLIDMWHNVRNALGILKVATKLECDNIVTKCMQYLEAVPWEENEEEELLNTLPSLGSSMMPVLARIQPVDVDSVRNVFLSAVRVSTLAKKKLFERLEPIDNIPNDLKAAAQEQVDYMLTEDDDAPLLIEDDVVKAELTDCFSTLFESFKGELAALVPEERKGAALSEDAVLDKVSDLSWASRVLPKVGLSHELVAHWVEGSDFILRILRDQCLDEVLWETKFKVVDLTAKVIEAVGYGTVIIPADQRTNLVNLWLPYLREMKPIFEVNYSSGRMKQRMDGDLLQTIDLALVSLILSLPSSDQAEILADWLNTDQALFPDLTEAFEVWCFRCKSAKRRFNLEVSGPVSTPISSRGVGV